MECSVSKTEDKKVHGHTKYQEDYPRQAHKLCLLGATDEEMSEFFQVCRDTIIRWRNEYPDFADACAAGKTAADAQVADALFNRAIGYNHPDTKMFLSHSEQGTTILSEEYTKHYPPDTAACKWWLNNRQKDKWQDKQEIEVKVSGDRGARLLAAKKRIKEENGES